MPFEGEGKLRIFLRKIFSTLLISWFKLTRPPRILKFGPYVNGDILRAFGAQIGQSSVLFSPIVLHNCDHGIKNLTVGESCVFNGNNYLDLSARITLKDGVSIGPGVTIMTHNGYNNNSYLVDRLAHTCGYKDVFIGRGANIKAHALIVMGVTIGEESVVAGGAVVNLDVPRRHLVAGVPARIVTEIV